MQKNKCPNNLMEYKWIKLSTKCDTRMGEGEREEGRREEVGREERRGEEGRKIFYVFFLTYIKTCNNAATLKIKHIGRL